ncbi:MAG TPA: biotin--[acetyl-CoA-carboxylase] ligase [Actinomycetota bacterium]|jgi:BirA family biotin operon repressor/biotin-[acetyl-CoA-carboxylase] ligase|nr:biotin--[acetyl-CoA-carboxylase] ligase [Actinomycetota bacterium]
MGVNQLERALVLAGLSAPVHWREVTGSTNELAVALAQAGAPEWTLVGAGHQTAGRGRRGRSWQDRPGRALMTSVVLRPSLPADALGLLTLLAGAAWAEAAREITGREVRCKWPNDLVTGEGKVGGVLAESSVGGDEVRWVVIGSGVNLAAPEVEGAAGLGDVDEASLLGGFLSRFRSAYESVPNELASEVVARWSAVSSTLGRMVAAIATDGTRREGEAVAVDRSGRLVIETSEGRVIVASDEVEHLR